MVLSTNGNEKKNKETPNLKCYIVLDSTFKRGHFVSKM